MSIASPIGTRAVIADHGPLGILLGAQADRSCTTWPHCDRLDSCNPHAGEPKAESSTTAETTRALVDRCAFVAVVSESPDPRHAALAYTPNSLDPIGTQRSADVDRPLPAAFLQYSSGTTGIKRGVLVTDDAVLAQLETYAQALALDDQDVMLSWLPLYHDMGFIACLNMPLRFGVHTIMMDPLDWVASPGMFPRAASEYGATLSWNPNFAYAFMADRVRAAISTASTSPTSGAW